MSIVTVEDVSKTFHLGGGRTVYAVNGVSLEVEAGQTMGLIGESGSGKSTLGMLILGLYQPDEGAVTFDGETLRGLPRRRLRDLRSHMTVVFQEPFESLNPRMSVGTIVEEPLVIHDSLSRAQRRARVAETLERVALPRSYAAKRPAELSGGQQQRVGIARAIVTGPKFIVLDEPTSSLDVSVQAQVLALLGDLQRELGLAYLYISHDVATVRHMSARLAVMYLGRIVEEGPATEVLDRPLHPYTKALLSSVLSPIPGQRREQVRLGGEIPDPTTEPQGCPLYGRCPIGTPECVQQPVELRPVGHEHAVACIKVGVPVAAGEPTIAAGRPPG